MDENVAPERMRQVAARLPGALVARVDRHADHLVRQAPGATITRSTAIRTLLAQALDRVEAEARS